MVVKLGSFSEAAKHLHTVQSNVTSHIKKLEHELKVEILLRQNPILPTRAGLQLYRYAEQMINLQKEIVQAFSQIQPVQNFPLTLGSMETTAAVRLPILLQDLQKIQPNLPIMLSTGSSRDLIDQVKASQLDCAFIANDQPIAELFNYHVWTEQLVLITARNAPQQLSTTYLSHQKFIAFKQGCSYRKAIDLFLSSHHLAATNILEMGSLDGIVSCVSLGVGVAILPLSYIQQSYFYPHICVHEITEDIATIHTYLIAEQPNKWSSNMTYFIDQLPALTRHHHGKAIG